MLSEIRMGVCTTQTEYVLRKTEGRKFAGAILPTQLTTHRAQVGAVNEQKLNELKGEKVMFTAIDSGTLSNSESDACQAPKELFLKIG